MRHNTFIHQLRHPQSLGRGTKGRGGLLRTCVLAALLLILAPLQSGTALADPGTCNTNSLQDNVCTGGELVNANSSAIFDTVDGWGAGNGIVSGSENTSVGAGSMNHVDPTNGTAIGFDALQNAGGSDNTGVGYESLFSATDGSGTGSHNTAVGENSLYSNGNGSNNVATGDSALYTNASGDNNTATGVHALYSNYTGTENVADGFQALAQNVSSAFNLASGAYALTADTGAANTGVGDSALSATTSGGDNTALGFEAGNSSNSANANVTGTDNTFIGAFSGPSTSTQLTNATAIGDDATVGESNALVLGGTGSKAVNVGIGTTTPDQPLTVAGTIESTSGGFKFPDGTVQTTAATGSGGVSSVTASAPLSSSGGSTPNISLSGTVPIANGGTGTTTGPSGAGQFLRSTGAGSWGVSALQASDLPAGSSSYIQNGTSPQSGASFNIGGSGTIGGTLTVKGTGASSVAGKLGVGNSTPQSTLQVGKPGSSYGSYLQIPMVSSSSAPPATACNTTTFVGRLVLQFNAETSTTTLWACTPAGTWKSV